MDELVSFFTCVALLLVIYHRYRQGRALKRLLKLLTEDQRKQLFGIEKPPAP
jgi:hypothetical protein